MPARKTPRTRSAKRPRSTPLPDRIAARAIPMDPLTLPEILEDLETDRLFAMLVQEVKRNEMSGAASGKERLSMMERIIEVLPTPESKRLFNRLMDAIVDDGCARANAAYHLGGAVALRLTRARW